MAEFGLVLKGTLVHLSKPSLPDIQGLGRFSAGTCNGQHMARSRISLEVCFSITYNQP